MKKKGKEEEILGAAASVYREVDWSVHEWEYEGAPLLGTGANGA